MTETGVGLIDDNELPKQQCEGPSTVAVSYDPTNPRFVVASARLTLLWPILVLLSAFAATAVIGVVAFLSLLFGFTMVDQEVSTAAK